MSYSYQECDEAFSNPDRREFESFLAKKIYDTLNAEEKQELAWCFYNGNAETIFDCLYSLMLTEDCVVRPEPNEDL